MKNYLQPGQFLTFAHNAAVASGTALLIGDILGIASSTYAANEPGEYALTGVYELPAASAAVGAIGKKAYWDAANGVITDAPDGAVLVGTFHAAKAAGQTFAAVRLSGIAH